ncbi:hypothetical protein BY458DRAFT_588894 [Sporodiniella umbellata]|nr:hypothetical protein BY458DRAFT_588894 [Sporodiniella umbellata]
MNRPETVYCVHKFTAGNADEIPMNVGEQVVIIEKDDEYKDGWWKGRNEKGQVGLFPVTYTTTTPLPAEDEPSSTLKLSGDSVVHKNSLGLSSKNTLSIVKQSLNSSAFQSKQVEEWSSEQVALWITDIGFDASVADIFRDQEITGDILLELTVESLKELNIDTFGKRFKLHAAIKALRSESNDTQSVSSLTSERKGDSHYNNRQTCAEDDMVSNYSAIIRNSSLPSRHDPRLSLDSQQPTLSRHNSQGSYNDIFRSQATTPRSILPERRHTISNNMKEKPGLPRSSSINKLHAVIPSTAMVRRSEDVPIAHEMPNTPDMEGWLFKQGDRYKNWNKRWFVLKGNNLFYFKSPKAVLMKGIINLKGYRVEVDSSIQAGKYCFKTSHEKERNFYFFTDQERYMKDWVKAMMKATIERDFNTPVMSSSTIPTVSLETARRMRPRPPSTLFLQRSSSLHNAMPSMEEEFIPPFGQSHTSASIMTRSPPLTSMSHRSPSWLGQSTRITDNTSEFSLDYPRAKDDSGFNSYPTIRSPVQSLTHSSSSSSTSTKNSACPIVRKSPSAHLNFGPDEEENELMDPDNTSTIEINQYQPHFSNDRPSTRHFQPTPHHLHPHLPPPQDPKTKDHLDWVNLYLRVKIDSLVDLSSGDNLLELLECLSNKDIGRNTHLSTHTPVMDRMVTAFEYMHQEGIELEHSYTFRDILSGRESKILSLLDSIKAWYQISPRNTLSPFPKYSTNKKTASGGTFGEEEQNKLRALDDPEFITA